MDKKVFFTALTLIIIGLFTFKFTFALLSDTAESTGNTFTAASVFATPTSIPTGTVTPTITPTPTGTSVSAGDVVINEVFAEGNSTTEWVEILNKTGVPVDVSGWTITDNSASDILPTVSPIPPGGYGVIIASASIVAVPGSAITIQLSGAIGGGLAEGGDRLSISAPIIGVVDSVNWGSDTTFFSPSAGSPGDSDSLARSPDGQDTNTAVDWVSDETPSIGITN